MTVTYSLNVANATLTGFTKLLLRWKGSIYKLLYRELVIYCGLYYMLSMSYRYLLNDKQKLIFEKYVEYCRTFTSVIPLSFVLGFYVSIVVTRWWQQFMQIPWPDKAVLLISGYVRGDDERGRIIRRTLARYLILMQVLTFQAVSTSVRRRFPTNDHIQENGLFTAEERMAYNEIVGTHGKCLIVRCRRAGRIKHDYLMDKIIEELHVYRTYCGMMFAYDWISIPLVYTQTVSIATYMYFAAAMIGRQYLDPREGQKTTSNDVDYYIPVFTILEFLCFMGWPRCLDRNLLISYTIVDEMYNKHPKLVPDIFWDKKEPILPYTKSSLGTKLNVHPHSGSTVNLAVEPEDFLPMETIMEEDHEDYNYSSPPLTSMVDYGSSQPTNWFQDYHSVINIEPQNYLPNSLLAHNKHQTKSANFSQNHSELIENLKSENLKSESNQSSRSTSRSGVRLLPDFIQGSKIVNKFLGGLRSNDSTNASSNQQPSSHQYQNYSNLLRQHQQQYAHNNLASTFTLKTPIRKQRHHPLASSHLNEPPIQLTNEQHMSNFKRSNQNQNPSPNSNLSLLVNQMPFTMNASSNASISGNLNTVHNLNAFNTSLSATTVNNSQHLSNSHQNLENSANLSSTNLNKYKLQGRKIVEQNDDLTSSNDDQKKFEQQRPNLNHRNLRLNRTLTLNQTPSSRLYQKLRTAPVLGTSSSTATNPLSSRNRISPFMNRLRNSLNNFGSHQYRNYNKFSTRTKRNSFSSCTSALSLKSKCDNLTSDQLVSMNGFHFPQSYIPPKNPNEYLPSHLQTQDSASILTLEQENELNDNFNNAAYLNRAIELQNEKIEIKISPASQRASQENSERVSFSDLNKENFISMKDLKNITKENNKENDEKDNSKNSNYTLIKAASILIESNENEIVELKSSAKPIINNQDSVPLTSGTLTEDQSSTHSSLAVLNQEDENNEILNLKNKNETSSKSSSSNSNETAKTTQTIIKKDDENDPEECEFYSPNEEPSEERYEDSPTNSNDSLSPYESNQNTVSSYTQLIEKEMNSKEY